MEAQSMCREVNPSCRLHRSLWSVAVLLVMVPGLAAAQGEGRTYTDSRGKKIVFPLGDASFADEVVSFDLGKPAPPDKRWADPKVALGAPDGDNPPGARAPGGVICPCASG